MYVACTCVVAIMHDGYVQSSSIMGDVVVLIRNVTREAIITSSYAHLTSTVVGGHSLPLRKVTNI